MVGGTGDSWAIFEVDEAERKSVPLSAQVSRLCFVSLKSSKSPSIVKEGVRSKRMRATNKSRQRYEALLEIGGVVPLARHGLPLNPYST